MTYVPMMVDYIGIAKLYPHSVCLVMSWTLKKSDETCQSPSINKTCSFQSNFLCGPMSLSRAIPAGASMESALWFIMIVTRKGVFIPSTRLSAWQFPILLSIFCDEIYIRPALVEWKRILSLTFASKCYRCWYSFHKNSECVSSRGCSRVLHLLRHWNVLPTQFQGCFLQHWIYVLRDLTKNEGNDPLWVLKRFCSWRARFGAWQQLLYRPAGGTRWMALWRSETSEWSTSCCCWSSSCCYCSFPHMWEAALKNRVSK